MTVEEAIAASRVANRDIGCVCVTDVQAIVINAEGEFEILHAHEPWCPLIRAMCEGPVVRR